MQKLISAVLISLAAIIAAPSLAFAHVVVSPSQANVGERVLFTIGIPNERDVAVNKIKLNIPNDLNSVQPAVAAGWAITTKTDSDKNVQSITWVGNIPAGQRADLTFKAQVPAKSSELHWKAYQTYADGITVSWDQTPSKDHGDSEDATTGPYSVTQVIDDLDHPAATSGDDTKATLALYASILALVFSVVSLFIKRKTTRK